MKQAMATSGSCHELVAFTREAIAEIMIACPPIETLPAGQLVTVELMQRLGERQRVAAVLHPAEAMHQLSRLTVAGREVPVVEGHHHQGSGGHRGAM
jgi:hypothetical protein